MKSDRKGSCARAEVLAALRAFRAAARFVTDGGVYLNMCDITPEEQAELAPRGVSAEAAGEGAPAGAELILYNLPPESARRAGGK